LDIIISFEKYIPKPNVIFGYFEVLKKMNFIADVKIINKGNELVIEIIRQTPGYQKNFS
jgi:hypothetical protein